MENLNLRQLQQLSRTSRSRSIDNWCLNFKACLKRLPNGDLFSQTCRQSDSPCTMPAIRPAEDSRRRYDAR